MYSSVARDPRVARLLPGFAVSYLGDGMSAIAVSWLALQLSPAAHRALWVAVAVAAYTFPAAIGTFALAGWLRGARGASLVRWNASLRAVGLGVIAVLGLTGRLSLVLFVVLLAVSSVLHAWGSAGTYTLVAELLPEREHLPANALLGTLAQIGVLVGPSGAGLVIAGWGVSWVVALDALSFAILALSAGLFAPAVSPRPAVVDGSAEPAGSVGPAESVGSVSAETVWPVVSGSDPFPMPDPSAATDQPATSELTVASAEPAGRRPRAAGFRVLLTDRRLAGLLALTFGFYVLYGPFEVGLPVYIADYRHAPASHLAWYYTAFGAGAIAGGLIAGFLRSWPLGPTTAGIVVGVGAALLPVGLGVPDLAGVASYAVAGLFFGPYSSLITALIQRVSDPPVIAQALAARGTVLIASGPAGLGLAALLIGTVGVRPALVTAAAATVLLGVLASVATRSGRWPRAGRRPVDGEAEVS